MRVLLLLLLVCAAPASAQWQYVGPSGTYDHTDFAIRDGVIVLSMSGSAGSSGLLRSADGGTTWTVPTLTFPDGGTPRPFTDGVRSVVALPTGFLANIRETGGTDGLVWFRPLANPTGAEGFNAYRYHDESGSREALYATNYAPAVGATALLRSLDDGATWASVAGPFTRLSFVHARGDTLLAGLAVGGAWLSVDGGTTWTDLGTRGVVGAGVGGFIGPDGSLYVNLAVGNFLGRSELWRSRDGGQTWTLLTGAIVPVPPDTPNSRNGIVYAEGSRVLFSAACQMYLSTDDGATWTEQTANVPTCTASGSSTGGISQMGFDGGFLYVLRQQFLSGNRPNWGLYRRSIGELGFAGPTAAAEGVAPASALALDLAPNPTSGATRIRFSLATPQHVRMTVFDVLGRRVLTVAEGLHGAGTHERSWDASSLRPGVYIVHIDAGVEGRSTQRFTVVR